MDAPVSLSASAYNVQCDGGGTARCLVSMYCLSGIYLNRVSGGHCTTPSRNARRHAACAERYDMSAGFTFLRFTGF